MVMVRGGKQNAQDPYVLGRPAKPLTTGISLHPFRWLPQVTRPRDHLLAD